MILAGKNMPGESATQPGDGGTAVISSHYDDTTNLAMGQTQSRVLAPHHHHMLHDGSAISDAVILTRGYWTATDAAQLRGLGFAAQQCRVPALVLPIWTSDGSNSLYVIRPDTPRSLDQKDKPKLPDGTYRQRVLKYENLKGSSMRLDCPPTCRLQLGDPTVPLWVTEGQKKADALASQGFCAIGLLGVWNWRGKNALGGLTALADWEYVALKDRDVRIVFDSDVMRKPEVQKALTRLIAFLQNRGAHATAVYLPHGEHGEKQGVDDFLAAGHTAADLEALVEVPRPLPQPAMPHVELLDSEPGTVRRPLILLADHAYAATWLYVRVTQTESVTRTGELVRLNPPVVTTERRLFVIRDDGRIFGDGRDASLDALGMEVHLPEIPPTDKLWSAHGVRAYKAGQRPLPRDVFSRVVDTVDQFIDFNRSLADQRTMAELVACYVLATWFLDAFTVIGFLWPNGDRGSGKTQLLAVVCELAYLGQVILAGGSYASLRDLADYGATLAFDDAENLSDPKRTDPDKRALLLAGNRKGNTVPVKELSGEKQWRTRHVNTFCPRLFSATQLPDPILASRVIVVPLIRTSDRQRANADPLDYSLWSHARQELLDDLWSLGLAHLTELPAYARRVNECARLTGRNLEPWRPVLAVALWLDEHGVPGLFAKMEGLSVSYQGERGELEFGDITVLVIRALRAKWAESAKCAKLKGDTLEFAAGDLVATMKQVINDDELADFDAERINTQKVGKVLRKRRLNKPPRSGGRGSRTWLINAAELRDWCLSYGLPPPDGIAASQVEHTGDDRDATEATLGVGSNDTSSSLGPLGSTWHLAQEREVFEL